MGRKAKTSTAEPAKRSEGRWRPRLAAAVIALAAAGAYHNSFRGPFIYDDASSIPRNPSIRSFSAALSPPKGKTVSGRPVINVSLALNYSISELKVWSYHLFNLTVHVLAGLTLFGIVRRTLLTPALRGRFGQQAVLLAFAIALIWTLHPLQTQAVTYVIQRCESVMGLFYLLTLYCVIRGAGSSRPFDWYALAVLSCLLGMASKEAMATAPVIVLLYDRSFLAGSFKRALRKRWPLYAGLAATWGLLGYLVFSSGARAGTAGFASRLDTWQYARTQFGVILHYLRLCFWPHPLCVDYFWPVAETAGQILPAATVIAVLLLTTVWLLARRPALGFVGAWFFVTLAPTSSVIPIADPAFEHRMYLSLAAVVALVVMAADLLWRRFVSKAGPGDGRAVRWVVGGVLLTAVAAALGTVTALRNRDYRSAVAIWRATIESRPENHRAHCNLGIALVAAGSRDEGIEHLERAVHLAPWDSVSHYNLAFALHAKGDLDGAIEHNRKAVQLRGWAVEPRVNLGAGLIERGKPEDIEEAIEHLQRAVRLAPTDAVAHLNLGNALRMSGKNDLAIFHCRRAIGLARATGDRRLADKAESLLRQMIQPAGQPRLRPAPSSP